MVVRRRILGRLVRERLYWWMCGSGRPCDLPLDKGTWKLLRSMGLRLRLHSPRSSRLMLRAWMEQTIVRRKTTKVAIKDGLHRRAMSIETDGSSRWFKD